MKKRMNKKAEGAVSSPLIFLMGLIFVCIIAIAMTWILATMYTAYVQSIDVDAFNSLVSMHRVNEDISVAMQNNIVVKDVIYDLSKDYHVYLVGKEAVDFGNYQVTNALVLSDDKRTKLHDKINIEGNVDISDAYINLNDNKGRIFQITETKDGVKFEFGTEPTPEVLNIDPVTGDILPDSYYEPVEGDYEIDPVTGDIIPIKK